MSKHESKHPLQPLVKDKNGVLRFKENKIVSFLLDLCTQRKIADLNALAIMAFSQEDREQFAQLIGYSLSGFGELGYVNNEAYDVAARQAEKLEKHEKKHDKKHDKKAEKKERKLKLLGDEE